jgi:hypothetical protein
LPIVYCLLSIVIIILCICLMKYEKKLQVICNHIIKSHTPHLVPPIYSILEVNKTKFTPATYINYFTVLLIDWGFDIWHRMNSGLTNMAYSFISVESVVYFVFVFNLLSNVMNWFCIVKLLKAIIEFSIECSKIAY